MKKNTVKAKGLKAQMLSFSKMEDVPESMRNFMRSGSELIDDILDGDCEMFACNSTILYHLNEILDDAGSIMKKIIDLTALARAAKDSEEEED